MTDSIPDHWPDEGTTGAVEDGVAPMFPLPGVFLFPGQLMPLHVFEPRYRQMIEDSLDGPGRMVIGTVLERDRADLSGSPPVVPIAGLGEIAKHEKLPDGRFPIWLFGIGRVRIEETESDRLYRRVRYQRLAEVGPTENEEGRLRPALVGAIEQRAGGRLESADSIPLGALADLLANNLTVPEPVMVSLHGETDVAERARKAIAADSRFPARPRDDDSDDE